MFSLLVEAWAGDLSDSLLLAVSLALEELSFLVAVFLLARLVALAGFSLGADVVPVDSFFGALAADFLLLVFSLESAELVSSGI